MGDFGGGAVWDDGLCTNMHEYARFCPVPDSGGKQGDVIL